MIKGLRVGLDLDGCLADFGADVLRYARSIGKDLAFKDNAAEPHTWNFFEHWKMPTAEFVQLCHDGADAGVIFRGPPRKNAVSSVWEIYDAGHDLVIITDRQFGSTPSVSHEATLAWWEENRFPPFKEIHFSSDKTCVPTDVFVEDKLENYDALIDNGTPAFLITRNWNRQGYDGRQRINDIKDYPRAIERLFVAAEY